MKKSFLAVVAAVLLLLAPGRPVWAALTPAQQQLLTQRTQAYLDALTSASYDQLSAIVTPNYKLIGPKGKTHTIQDVIAAAAKNRANSAHVYRQIKIGTVTPRGTALLVENLSSTGNTNVFLDGNFITLTFYTEHTILWFQGPDGTWRVAEDRVTHQSNNIGLGT